MQITSRFTVAIHVMLCIAHFERKMKKADRNNGYGRKRKQQREVHI